jgi:hypothetical protein
MTDADAPASFWHHDKYSDEPNTRDSPPRFNEKQSRRTGNDYRGFRIKIENLSENVVDDELKVNLQPC